MDVWFLQNMFYYYKHTIYTRVSQKLLKYDSRVTHDRFQERI